jgi:NADH-quinone oxidoreductase subunit C
MIPACLSDIAALRAEVSDPARTGFCANLALEPAAIKDAVQRLSDAGYFIESLGGADFAEGFEILYVFDRWEVSARVALRVLVPHDAPVVPTVSDIFPGALWHERETYDFYGVQFEGHPELKPLLLPDDMTLRPLVKEPEARKKRDDIAFPPPPPPPGAEAPAKPKPKPKAAAAPAEGVQA